jgi:hypothetical protein
MAGFTHAERASSEQLALGGMRPSPLKCPQRLVDARERQLLCFADRRC